MTESIDTAPKDGTKILCICSDGKTRYCWWFGCSAVDGCWMTEEIAEPVAWYTIKRLPPSLKERGREALQNIHAAVVMETGGRELDVLKEIVESLPD